MLRSSDRFALFALGLVAFWGAVSAPTRNAVAEGKPSRLTAEVGQLRNDKGTIFCSLFNSEEGFPTLESKAFRLGQAKPKDKRAVCDFGSVPAGTYAVSVIHDENDNKKLDTNFFGAPIEGYGASNDARSSFGPPKFKDAKFDYKGGPLALKITVHY
jgi:uncharacterized protein (DUF2141 family)